VGQGSFERTPPDISRWIIVDDLWEYARIAEFLIFGSATIMGEAVFRMSRRAEDPHVPGSRNGRRGH
jgi:hypothetical protein